ncbi:hypothetical protein [Xanthomonas albilineans]|uniref:hypothetical protein n=1 Tax=Xanthomonas albilineans TaxID=29447 RepID=UPI0005F3140D|nr:hypothetical protein [Xanthomonas albilineans]
MLSSSPIDPITRHACNPGAFSCGFHITVGLQFAPVRFDANFMLGSTFLYSLFQTGRPIFFGLNLFAVAMSLVLAQTLQRRLPA